MAVRSLDEQSLFEGARSAATAELREAYLNEHCDDPALRCRIDALLRAFDESESFLEMPPPELSPCAIGADGSPSGTVSEGPGTVIGPYQLLQQIGDGGMGVVFLAEQSKPIQRRVALKIIKPGMDSRQVIARFEAERQALAMMDHPNIAKVLDAGTTAPDGRGYAGRPYFVMELVSGVPITKYCDDKHLSLRERLDLFMPVCRAVQHAHQKGIIHRDLKPSNVLVAEYDERAVSKIIDFGVAKAIAQKLVERTMYTAFGQVIGTVEYMSPEQAKLNQLDVDARSDIYSLGVLLYELLTGSTPFERERLQKTAFDEVLRIIREEDPPKPSTRLSSLSLRDTDGAAETEVSSIAANRQTEPERLTSDLSGDLDWIVMKCLEKDRNRRYETAAALASDIERYRADEPISARPPSRTYRIAKLIRRNKAATVAVAAVFIGLLVAAVGASIGMLSESRRRVAAEREQATAELNLASALQSQERYAESEDLYRKVLGKTADSTADQQEAARARLQLARTLLGQDRVEEAEKMMAEAVSAHRSAFPAGDLNTAYAISHHAAILLNNLGRSSEAELLFREVLESARSKQPENHAGLAKKLLNLGNALAWQHKFAEAEPYYRDSIAQYELAVPPDPITLALARVEFAFILIRLNRFAEAEDMALKSAPVLQSNPPWRLFSAAALASLYARWDKAEPGKGYDKKAREWSHHILDTYVLRGALDESRTSQE